MLTGVGLASFHAPVYAIDWQWNLPPGFPTPLVPPGNPMTVEKVVLGRFLFYDTNLSGNQTQACASCHQQMYAFTDRMKVGVGSTGQSHPRNSMTLTNVAYAATLAWANPNLTALEKQVLLPMFGDMPVELGLSRDDLPERFQPDPRYRRLFAEAFPDDDNPFSQETMLDNVVQALTSFVRTLISGNAPYDRYINGLDDFALSPSAQRGVKLFFTERLECFHCHNPFAFTDSVTSVGNQFDSTPFHNNGLYNIDGKGGYPPNNTGILPFFPGVPSDMGAFKAPTLRNVELTFPYMHDGSIDTLDHVLDHYAAGGRTITEGQYPGDGSKNPFKSGFIRGFQLTDQERQDVLNFLTSLTDEDFVSNPHFSDPVTTQFCSGDCSLDGTVAVDEVLTGVGVALETAHLAACVTADTNGDGTVSVDELIAAVNRAATSCTAAASTAEGHIDARERNGGVPVL
jgi:cytochrome c peroxidase